VTARAARYRENVPAGGNLATGNREMLLVAAHVAKRIRGSQA
jgi:hypothetical protein